MRLTDYTDYTLRVLMYCAANRDRLVTIAELAERHAVSKNHLMKIVNDMARQGVLETTRGRGGGVRIHGDPAQIRLGDVVRAAEPDFRLVECFDRKTNSCPLTPTCRLKHVVNAALNAFLGELDKATLADLAVPAIRAANPGPATRTGGRKVVPLVTGPRAGRERAAKKLA